MTCKTCNGTGWIVQNPRFSQGLEIGVGGEECPDCVGRGLCPQCGGGLRNYNAWNRPICKADGWDTDKAWVEATTC